jgi:uncharacterized protein
MIAIISPAKTLDFEKKIDLPHTLPRFKTEANSLVRELRKKNPADLQTLMDISDNLATLNVDRFHNYSTTKLPNHAKQAVYAFKGDVYRGLEVEKLGKPALDYIEDHLRILSGLYGLLRPYDLIQPYRLEMGTSLDIREHHSLYSFWGNKITNELNRDLKGQGDDVLINLASQEYFKSVNKKKLKGNIVDVEFRDYSGGSYKVLAVYAKKARGMMVRFMAENALRQPEELKSFDMEGYAFDDRDSTASVFVFKRR